MFCYNLASFQKSIYILMKPDLKKIFRQQHCMSVFYIQRKYKLNPELAEKTLEEICLKSYKRIYSGENLIRIFK
jgi:phage pi2 protein 07